MDKKDDTPTTPVHSSSSASASNWKKGKGRRSFLQVTGTFAVAALSGCSSDSDASGASIVDSGALDGDAGALDGDVGLDATDGSPDADGGVIYDGNLPELNWEKRSDWLDVRVGKSISFRKSRQAPGHVAGAA
jgi:hypothetical protein